MADITVRDNPEASRYEVFVDGAFAGVADYQVSDDAIVFPHVEIEPAFRGSGVAAALVRYALEAVRDEGTRTVVPDSPYVTSYIQRHPEYQDLVDGTVQAPGDD